MSQEQATAVAGLVIQLQASVASTSTASASGGPAANAMDVAPAGVPSVDVPKENDDVGDKNRKRDLLEKQELEALNGNKVKADPFAPDPKLQKVTA